MHNSDFSTSYDASEEKADNEWSRSQGKSADSEITRSSRRKLKKKRISNAIVQLNEETTYKQSYVDEITNGMCTNNPAGTWGFPESEMKSPDRKPGHGGPLGTHSKLVIPLSGPLTMDLPSLITHFVSA